MQTMEKSSVFQDKKVTNIDLNNREEIIDFVLSNIEIPVDSTQVIVKPLDFRDSYGNSIRPFKYIRVNFFKDECKEGCFLSWPRLFESRFYQIIETATGIDLIWHPDSK